MSLDQTAHSGEVRAAIGCALLVAIVTATLAIILL
jgi:hypothetical protein